MDSFNDLLEKKITLGFFPTPLHKLENLTKHFNGPNIYIKRDDLTGLAFGGSKTRKLEYIFHEVLKGGHDSVITIATIQSNHARLTTAACMKLGLKCYLILVGDKNDKEEGNLYLNKLLGANITIIDYNANSEEKAKQIEQELIKEGKKPYFISVGGSSPAGTWGEINAYTEVMKDEINMNLKFDYIFFASSSLGTQCGLVLGKKMFDKDGKMKVYGVSVGKPSWQNCAESDRDKIFSKINFFNEKYGTKVEVKDDDVIFDERLAINGYGELKDEEKSTLALFAQLEGILLDPIYTARAAAVMIDLINKKEISKDCNVLFLHTGGLPALLSDFWK